MKYKGILLGLFCVLLTASCLKETHSVDKIREDNDELLKSFIENNNLVAEKTESGLYIVIEQLGNDTFPTLQDTVSVFYKGYLTSGFIFDQTDGENPATFPLNRVITGWQEGIPYFSEGSKGKLLIPSHLAYGMSGTQSIPPNSPIVFDIELINVQ